MSDRVKAAGNRALEHARGHDLNEVDALTYEAGALFGANEALLYDEEYLTGVAKAIVAENGDREWDDLLESEQDSFIVEAESVLALAGMSKRVGGNANNQA